jgi:hypothetical protein
MWLRLERADGSTAWQDDGSTSTVTIPEWVERKIDVEVGADVSRVVVGFMLFGAGTGWVDDVTLEAADLDKPEPPRPLTERGVKNLTALARLYGYVRHFHPSDQAIALDWESYLAGATLKVEGTRSDRELATRLGAVFAPIAPSVQVYLTGRTPPPLVLEKGPRLFRWEHHGVGLPEGVVRSVYKSLRTSQPAEGTDRPAVHEAELVPGVWARVPLALYADAAGTFPHVPAATVTDVCCPSVASRNVRIAAVIVVWNVFQHFYPYFDRVRTDWGLELSKALRAAATDREAADFEITLNRMVATVRDGHGAVSVPSSAPQVFPPITMDWVEKEMVVTSVRTGAPEGIARGDRVLAIDGITTSQKASEHWQLLSAATQGWMLRRLMLRLNRCNPDSKRLRVDVEPYGQAGASRTFELACAAGRPVNPEFYPAPRPKITELEPGIWYVDLRRVTQADWKRALSNLEKATALVFDVRGYPTAVAVLPHLTRAPMRSLRWNMPRASKPDRTETVFEDSSGEVRPAQPFLGARRVFLTDGSAVSYAESVLGFVESYKLGEIVGEPTAGTSGDVNSFALPGGYRIEYTGMKVLKQDGSPLHGVGIRPTVPATRTRAGVAAGRDEVLERALALFR